MMNPKELLDAGHLAAAIEQLNQEVRTHPSDAHRRTFLFELLCFAGDYPRAERQLDVIAQQETAAEVGVQVYRNVLVAESTRRRLFSEGLRPHFLFDPPAYVQLHLEAISRLREANAVEAEALLETAANARPDLKGQIEGEPFADFRDGDDLLAPVLELIVHNMYIWLPFEQIKQLTIAAPKRLRDLLWIPAQIEAHQGPVGEVFLPVLYADSSQHADERVKLGRMTEWQAAADGLIRGVGQRLFFIDGQDRGVLEVRGLEFAPPANPASEA
jgi:type VI secretion system protein ImpE